MFLLLYIFSIKYKLLYESCSIPNSLTEEVISLILFILSSEYRFKKLPNNNNDVKPNNEKIVNIIIPIL